VSLTGAALLATTASYVVYLTIAWWYVVPALRKWAPVVAIGPLL